MTDERSQLLQMDFEAWALIHLEHLAHDLVLDTTWGGTYANKEVEAAWKAWSWQAAQAAQEDVRTRDIGKSSLQIMQEEASRAAPADGYIATVPDKCDRIIWRNQYFGLPIAAPAQPAPSLIQWAAKVLTLRTWGHPLNATDSGRLDDRARELAIEMRKDADAAPAQTRLTPHTEQVIDDSILAMLRSGAVLPPAQPADPCPQCKPGGTCNRVDCGRKQSSELMARYGTTNADDAARALAKAK
jgi:hypothetical protein